MLKIKKKFFQNKVYLFSPKIHNDSRGAFLKIFDPYYFKDSEINFFPKQICISKNKLKGTLRGLHFQTHPYAEKKIITCIKGKILDVFVDIRPKSKTYLKSQSVILSENEENFIFLPKGFAHGFITLEKNSNVLYLIDGKFKEANSSGLRWDDPKIDINWLLKPKVISDKDKSYKLI